MNSIGLHGGGAPIRFSDLIDRRNDRDLTKTVPKNTKLLNLNNKTWYQNTASWSTKIKHLKPAIGANLRNIMILGRVLPIDEDLVMRKMELFQGLDCEQRQKINSLILEADFIPLIRETYTVTLNDAMRDIFRWAYAYAIRPECHPEPFYTNIDDIKTLLSGKMDF